MITITIMIMGTAMTTITGTNTIIRMVTLIDTVTILITTMTSVENRQVHWAGHDLGVPPPPRAPGSPGSRLTLRKSGRPDLRWGRGGEGGRRYVTRCVRQLLPPPLTPPHKGKGNTEPAANSCSRGSFR
jgi:hypothetical protein